MPCLTQQFNPQIGPIINVIVAPAGQTQAASVSVGTPPPLGAHTFTAFPLLIDTGADITCISPAIAQQLGLTSLGLQPVGVATGASTSHTFMVDLGIPFAGAAPAGQAQLIATTFGIDSRLVMQFGGSNPFYQGLLGRDILDMGHFSISGFARTFTLCF
jgi:hypothetical protein